MHLFPPSSVPILFFIPKIHPIEGSAKMTINPCGDLLPGLPSGISTAKSSFNGPLLLPSKCFGVEEREWKGQDGQFVDDELGRLSKFCWQRFDSRSSLQLLVLLNFLLDGLCTYLSLDHMFVSYIFAGCAIISLLTICAVINGIQEEKKTMIKVTGMYAGIKALVLMALTLTAFAGFIEEHIINDRFRASFELKLLFCLLPLFAVSLSIQYKLSQRIVGLFRLKDELYVIPSVYPNFGRELMWKRRKIEPIENVQKV